MAGGEAEPRMHVDARNAQGLYVGDHGHQHVHHHYAAQESPPWPVVVGRAPLRAAAFQKRADRSDGSGVTILAGDGGTGKTQLAVAMFERALRSKVDLALWVTATSRPAVVAAYAQAYRQVRPRGPGNEAERDAEAFLNWLAGTDRSWIIVLDDLADPADLTRLWPAGPAGQVIATTRRRDAAISARGPLVDVGVFTPDQSLSYLTAKLVPERGGSEKALHGAASLAAALGYLPLALAQSAAVIIDDGITCAQYLELLGDRSRRLTDLFPSDPQASGDDYERTLAGTWSLAADRADAMPPHRLARSLLRLAAVLDPNGIPEAVLTAPSALRYLATEASASDSRRALRNLHKLSLIAHDTDDTVRSVRMHALAQRSTLDELRPDDLVSVINTAAEALLGAWPAIERDPGLGAALRANASAVEQAAASHSMPVPRGLQFRVGTSLLDAGLAFTAVNHFETMLRGEPAESIDGLRIRQELAVSRGDSGDPVGALAGLRAVLADRLRLDGPDHPDLLAVRISLANWQGESGDFAGAARALEPLVADLTRLLGAGHPVTIGARASQAFWVGNAGDPSSAAAATEALLEDYSLTLPQDHPKILSSRHNLAHWRGSAGNPAAAVAAYEELLDDCLRALGPAHPQTLDTRRNLAHWRGQWGDPAGATVALETVSRDYGLVLGRDHPDSMHAREDLAYWRGEAGDAAGSVTAYEELLADRQRVLGPDHPHTFESRYHLADRRGHAGDLDGAVAELEQLAGDRSRVLGADHPHTLRTQFKLADWRGQNGDAAGAHELLKQVLADQVRLFGAKHPDSLTTRHELAFWTGETGAASSALAAFTDLYADQLEVLGPGHPDTLATRNELLSWLGLTGDPAGAVDGYQELLALCLDGLGPDHLETLDVRRNLAVWRARSGDPAAGADELRVLVADALRIMGPHHPRVLEYRATLDRWDEHR
ncbi:tetratricopeptide repeat protein [Kribbella sp. NPDC051620]|uniref:tetratricopeptide repeat protein n=1 Tax=Kribbella sp. NPDC051620 TaxID=3364120 RepID=UPI0037B632D0